MGEGVELGEGGAALGPQRLRPVQHLRNPPLLVEWWYGNSQIANVVTRIGSAWSDTPTKPAFALVLGAGAMAPLTPRGGTAFRIDLEDYLSFAQFELSDGTRSKAHPYHDLVWSIGLAIPISKGSGR